MKFTINLAFWEMFKKRSPNGASDIQPFSVDLYDPQIKKLDQPVDLENLWKQWVHICEEYPHLKKEKPVSQCKLLCQDGLTMCW